jgi:tRNA (adenine57-N1/adenine58-N1)-methyltransferase
MFILKSEDYTGILDNNTAYVRGEKITLPGNYVYDPGDSIKIKGREYIVLNCDPLFYNEVTERYTQTVLPLDISYILYSASINSGKNVLESGVGIGNLSYSILNSIGKSGKLTGIDINEKNIENARKNLSRFINTDNWNLINDDIKNYKSNDIYDAIILDMPDPWNAISNIKHNLKPGGYIILYSPNYNQTEKNVVELKKNKFFVVETVELIKRNIIVRENATRPDNNIIGHTAFINIAIKTSKI